MGSDTIFNQLGSSIETAEIATGAVTGPKIAMGSDAQGDILFHNGTSYARLAPGTSGQFLKTQGAAANPLWASAGTITSLGQGSATTTSTTAVEAGNVTNTGALTNEVIIVCAVSLALAQDFAVSNSTASLTGMVETSAGSANKSVFGFVMGTNLNVATWIRAGATVGTVNDHFDLSATEIFYINHRATSGTITSRWNLIKVGLV